MIGKVFDDRYEVVRKLGSGGMADVYLAHDRLLGRQVALKVLSSRYANDEQFVERFRREASAAAGLTHPNIVQIYDRGEAEGTYYIAMEYLEGRRLKDIILRYAPLDPELILSISIQIAEALRFAHRRNVIHRDIKPQNVIVDAEGRVKVTDFGIARAGNATSMTEAGSILGTAHYLSPEQAQGRSVEAASDLYSLGVVMYEMATGKLPFDGDNPVTIAMRHVHEQPVPPRNLVPDIPENLEAVILRALAKEPTERYLTAQAMLDDLRRVQNGEPVAPPPAYAEEPTQVMRADEQLVSGPQATQVRKRAPKAPEAFAESYREPPRRQGSLWPWVLVVVLLLALGGAAYAIFFNWGNSGQELAVVPSVLGLTGAEAKDMIEAAGFKFENAGEQPSLEYPVGRVCRQEPEEGVKLAKGETVSVWLSSGEGKVEVPNVVGKEAVEAAAILGALGLEPSPQNEVSTEAAPGTVLRQDPVAGTLVNPGSTVVIVVAIEAETVAVPYLIGMTEEAAVALLETMGLEPKIQPVDSTMPGGTVVDQDPSKDKKVPPGSTVTLFVSNAPEPTTVTVPAVGGLGYTPEQATRILQQYSLRAKIKYYETPDFEPGLVIQQDPPAGSVVQKNSYVELLVSAKPSTTTITQPSTTTTQPSTTTTQPSTTTTTKPPSTTTQPPATSTTLNTDS